MTNATTVAQTIASQLGNKALVMWGAKNRVDMGNGMSFKVGRNAAKITHVAIKLNGSDLYDVKFEAVRGANVRPISSFDDIDVSNLRGLIVDQTGMYASL